MNDITQRLKSLLLSRGAALVGFADISALPPEPRRGFPRGVAIAVVYPKETIRGIVDMPTREYHARYNELNEKLDALASLGAETLLTEGYGAVAQTREYVNYIDGGNADTRFETALPHKTAARLAGLGWIGKSALFVTREYGSMIRLTSILTDAPLKTAEKLLVSECGGCTVCTQACPGGAVLGKNWSPGTSREEIFSAGVCNKTARERMARSTGVTDVTICGRCIAVCPYTQGYLNKE